MYFHLIAYDSGLLRRGLMDCVFGSLLSVGWLFLCPAMQCPGTEGEG